jgi:hypothetical protein
VISVVDCDEKPKKRRARTSKVKGGAEDEAPAGEIAHHRAEAGDEAADRRHRGNRAIQNRHGRACPGHPDRGATLLRAGITGASPVTTTALPGLEAATPRAQRGS